MGKNLTGGAGKPGQRVGSCQEPSTSGAHKPYVSYVDVARDSSDFAGRRGGQIASVVSSRQNDLLLSTKSSVDTGPQNLQKVQCFQNIKVGANENCKKFRCHSEFDENVQSDLVDEK